MKPGGNDSFLKMIGMSDSSMIEVKSKPVSARVSHAVANPVASEELAEDFDSEPTQVDEVPEDTGAFLERELLQESTEELNSDTDPVGMGRTSAFDETDQQELLQDLQQDVSEEDRLLEGLEEAEFSRATDIFAKSFRSDYRKTRAALSSGAESFVDFEDEDSADENPTVALPEEEISNGSRTIILDKEIPGEDDDFVEATLALGDPLDEALDDVIEEALLSNRKSRPSRVTNAGRRTVAFEYESSFEDNVPEDKYHRFHIVGGPLGGQTFLIEELPFSIGRDPTNKIWIDDSNVSRFHAEVRDISGQYTLVDLNSTNGIKVNGVVLTEKKLLAGDQIEIGNCRFQFLLPEDLADQLGATVVKTVAADDDRNHATIVSPLTSEPSVVSAEEVAAAATVAGKGWIEQKQKRMKRVRRMAVIVGIMGLAVMVMNDSFGLKGILQSGLSSVAQKGVYEVLEAMPEQIASDLGKPIAQASADEVKAAVLKKVALLPGEYRSLLERAPAELHKLVLSDPELYQTFVDSGGVMTEVFRVLRNRMLAAKNANRNEEAMLLVDIFLKENPQNQELLALQRELKNRLAYVQLESAPEVTDEDRATFARVMTDKQNEMETYLTSGDLEAARAFAIDTRDRIMQLVKKNSAYSKMTESAVAEWNSKIRQIEKKTREQQERQRKVRELEEKGAEETARIDRLFSEGKLAESLKAVDEFLVRFPDHSDFEHFKKLRQFIQTEIEKTVEVARDVVEQNVRTENYKGAWDIVYKTIDAVGSDLSGVKKLKNDLDARTAPRGAQFYNQARVFEFEADDLIAAEQYYKRTLDTVDPRSELAEKAGRRYAEVKRKTIR